MQSRLGDESVVLKFGVPHSLDGANDFACGTMLAVAIAYRASVDLSGLLFQNVRRKSG